MAMPAKMTWPAWSSAAVKHIAVLVLKKNTNRKDERSIKNHEKTNPLQHEATLHITCSLSEIGSAHVFDCCPFLGKVSADRRTLNDTFSRLKEYRYFQMNQSILNRDPVNTIEGELTF
jgi:hypothetical protein